MRSSARRASCRTSRSRTRPTRSGAETEPKGWCVARLERDGRDDRESPGKPGALRGGGGAPRSLVDQQGVRLLCLNRALEIRDLGRRPFAELPEPERSAPNRVRARHPRVRTARSRAQSTRWKGQSNAVGPRPVARSAPRRDALGGPAPPVSARAGTGGPGRRLHTRRQHPSLPDAGARVGGPISRG